MIFQWFTPSSRKRAIGGPTGFGQSLLVGILFTSSTAGPHCNERAVGSEGDMPKASGDDNCERGGGGGGQWDGGPRLVTCHIEEVVACNKRRTT